MRPVVAEFAPPLAQYAILDSATGIAVTDDVA